MVDSWERLRPYYASLSLARDGDETEQFGVENHRLNERWPAFEPFWRFHVAPATERPNSQEVRRDVSPLTLELVGSSYRTFTRVVSICDVTLMLQKDLSYERTEYWRQLAAFHETAMESFTEFVAAAAWLQSSLGEPAVLPVTQSIQSSERFVRYLAYALYLSGLNDESINWVYDEKQRIATVLSPEALLDQKTGDENHDSRRSQERIALVEAIRRHADDLIACLDVGFSEVSKQLDQYLHRQEYRRLWGSREASAE